MVESVIVIPDEVIQTALCPAVVLDMAWLAKLVLVDVAEYEE